MFLYRQSTVDREAVI